ncbi:hypothetical protein [Brevundimonas sp. UBA7664]|uniref:hypothetical protein n=1 Tax=Brevundimonas sp. UBA7664 TaxID=1946141 RepID=UPI0025BA26F2|nr:hypothetical protein [Brevundimonas sp. UBA7664]
MTEADAKATTDPKKIAGGCGCLVLILGGIGLALAMCTGEPENPAAKGAPEGSVLRSDQSVQSATRLGGELAVELKIANSWDDKGWLDGAAMAIEQVGRDLKAGAPEDAPPLDTVRFAVSVPGTDRLGEDVEIRLFHLTYSAADLRRANYDNLNSSRIPDLSSDVSISSRQGREVLTAWCADEVRSAESPSFCRRALIR